jgi:membrane-associated protein
MSAAGASGTVAAVSGGILHHLLVLHGPAAYALVGFLAFAEAAIFVGFVFPGETAVVLGGVLASQHAVSLVGMAAVVVVAAIVGDSVGYEVGRHYGERALNLRLLRPRRVALERARAYLRERGGRAVFLGRFTAFLRAVMPGLAGLSHMPYRRFLAFNAAGGFVWGVGFTLLGYVAGASYEKVEKAAGWASTSLLVVVVGVLVGIHLYRRRQERRAEQDTKPSGRADAA